MELSIIIPAYNCVNTLNRALQSALDQTIDDLEVIIVDDGSTDGTSTYADKLAFRWGRIKVIHQENKGPSAARQAGLDAAQGEWIAFLDADDYMEPKMCEKLINTCIKENVSVASCNFNITHSQHYNNTRWHWKPGKYNIKDNLIWTDNTYDIGFLIGKIYNAKAIKKLNIPFPNCNLAEDAIWNAEIYYLLKEIAIIDDALYSYDITDNSLSHRELSSDRRFASIKCLDTIYEKYNGKKFFYDYWLKLSSFMANVFARKAGDRPIDFVIPYVDCNDRNWEKLYKKYVGEVGDENIRFNNNGMFPLFWRCLASNLRDCDIIHLVVQSKSQIPDWLDTTKIHVVTHGMFMPKSVLPTFNSSTIEMFIQNIPGLSNRFLYSNDDFYITGKLSSNVFFNGDKPLNTYTLKKVHDKDDAYIWESTFKNATDLAIKGTFKENTLSNEEYYTMEHTLRAFNRSQMKEAYKAYETDILKSCSIIRESKNMNIFLFGIYDWARNKAGNKKSYVLRAISDNDVLSLQEKMDEHPHVMSINDTELSGNINQIKEYMKRKYPKICKYEVYDSM